MLNEKGSMQLKTTFNKNTLTHSALPYEPEKWNRAPDYQEVIINIGNSHVLRSTVLTENNNFIREQGSHSYKESYDDLKAYEIQFGLIKTADRLNSDGLEKTANHYGINPDQLKTEIPLLERWDQARGYETHANCYSYAVNDMDRNDPGGTTPGMISGVPVMSGKNVVDRESFDLYKNNLIAVSQADGLINIGSEIIRPQEGHYLVGLYARYPDDKYQEADFHYIRQNSDGSWSHKAGYSPVTNLDIDGKIIDDPRTANIENYEFITFFEVPRAGLNVGNPETNLIPTPHNDNADYYNFN